MQQLKDFMEIGEEERIEKGLQMSNKERDTIMKAAARTNDTAINDNISTIEEETSLWHMSGRLSE
jgi:hypothetical protein